MKDKRKWFGKNCLYKCPYYQDGNVFSFCKKYFITLSYHSFKPLRCPECVEEK